MLCRVIAYVLCLFILQAARSEAAGDSICGVNYFNGWCRENKKEGSEDKKKSESGPYDWQPKFANEPPPLLVDAFRDPSPQNIERYREWYKKRMERIWELSRNIPAPYGQSQIQATDGTSQQRAVNETESAIFSKAVYFFSESCTACSRMTPLLSEFQQSGKLVGIGIRSTDRSAVVYLERYGVSIPSAGDYKGEIANNYKVTATPTLILLSNNGDVVGRYEGAMDEAALSRLFKTELKAKKEERKTNEAGIDRSNDNCAVDSGYLSCY